MKTPALAIMAKQPRVGKTKTRLCPPLSPPQAAALAEALLKDSIALGPSLQQVQLAIAVTPPEAQPYFEAITPPGTILFPVSGPHIGAVLDQTLAHLLAAGHPKALGFNADGPSLPPDYIRQAIDLLDSHAVVLGPSEDGGYYLIGLTQPQPALFEDIAWSTPAVMAQTLAAADRQGLSVAQLPAWYDIDTAADMQRLQTELKTLPADQLRHSRAFFAKHPLPHADG